MRLLVSWLFLAIVLVWIYGSANSWLLWAHLHWPPHRQRIARAEFCLEAANHWENHPEICDRFLAEAYTLCDDCGCPVDCWPVGVIAIHAEVPNA